MRRELLDKVLVVNERHLRRILTIYLHHFNTGRPHRTLAQLAPAQAKTQPHQCSTLPTISCAADPSSTGSPASTRSQHDRTDHRKPAGQPQNPIFEPRWIIVTDRRLLQLHCVLSTTVDAIHLDKITDSTYHKSLIGHVFNFGTLRIESSGQTQSIERIDLLPCPDTIYRATLP